MKLDRFLELCERAARDVELDEEVIGRMGEASYVPLDDLADDNNSHFLWLEALADYVRFETENEKFDFSPPPSPDINEMSLNQLYDLIAHPYVSAKPEFMKA